MWYNKNCLWYWFVIYVVWCGRSKKDLHIDLFIYCLHCTARRSCTGSCIARRTVIIVGLQLSWNGEAAVLSGGFFQYVYFHLYFGKMNPFWRAYCSNGWETTTNYCFMLFVLSPDPGITFLTQHNTHVVLLDITWYDMTIDVEQINLNDLSKCQLFLNGFMLQSGSFIRRSCFLWTTNNHLGSIHLSSNTG